MSFVVSRRQALAMGAAAAFAPLPARADSPRLARGVTVSHWLEHEGRQPIRARDMVDIRNAGFDHVRIAFDAAYLGWKPGEADPQRPIPRIGALDEAVGWATAAGLEAILDFHIDDDVKPRIEEGGAAERAYVELWRWLAAHYRDRPADKVAFEPMNEPQYYERGGTRRWNALQHEVAGMIRGIAPQHTLILTGPYGSSIEGLKEVEPTGDPNSRYVFHFYEPHLVSHLGASWRPFRQSGYLNIRNLPYPAQAGTAEILPGEATDKAAERLRKYLDERWDAARIMGRVREAATWAAAKRVPLICTEFGIMRDGPLSPGSRLRYLGDVRAALDFHRIGWTVFDYVDVFGVAYATGSFDRHDDGALVMRDPKTGTRTFDQAAMRALGLR